ncbi:hypothetical protein ABT282_08325 [Streptomyces sp. NPDC000927]|uniref:hypothetical protein n=1 Tax=Streptomyces sp. NPDC000927 TaxID=3154371 RepID=UPI00332074E0
MSITSRTSRLPRRTYAIVHLSRQNFRADDDMDFADCMGAVAESVCAMDLGTVFAYTRGTSIDVLVADPSDHGVQPWFEGDVSKILSLSASLATSVLHAHRPGCGALFGAQVSTLTSFSEVADHFIRRQGSTRGGGLVTVLVAEEAAKVKPSTWQWDTRPAPRFHVGPGGWLANVVPTLDETCS